MGSGPYKVESSALNRSVSYRRRPDYWAAELPVCRGFYNFDRITYEYFGDPVRRHGGLQGRRHRLPGREHL